MLGALAASKAAKAAAMCICPVVGTAAITLSVPKVRDAVHRVTAPKQLAMASTGKPRQYAKSRVRPARTQTALNCPEPAIGTAMGPAVAPFLSAPVTTLPDTPGGQSALGGLSPEAAPAATGGTPGAFLPATNLVFPGVGGGVAGPAPTTGGGNETPPVTLIPVPESEIWVQMIGGFAAIGGVIRLSKRPSQPIKKPAV